MDKTKQGAGEGGLGNPSPVPSGGTPDGSPDGSLEYVACPGCSEVVGYTVKHLPPACVYDKGQPVQVTLPGMVPPEGVVDLIRERLREPDMFTVRRSEYESMQGAVNQLNKLADFILKSVPGVPIQKGQPVLVVDCAIEALKVHMGMSREIGQAASPLDRTALEVYISTHWPEDLKQGPSLEAAAKAVIKRLHAVSVQKGADWDRLTDQKIQLDMIALCLRDRYQAEIRAGKHNQFKTAADTAVYYMAVERDLTQRGFWGRVKYLVWGV